MASVLQFTAPRDEEGLAALNTQVEQALEGQDLPPKVVFAVQLVVDELVSNIVRHGSGAPHSSEIALRLTFDPAQIIIEIESAGDYFDPFARAEPALDLPTDERPIGGLGIHLTRNVMDDCRHEYRDGRNIVTLRKNLALDGSGESGQSLGDERHD